jgi:hypothetical protein
LTTRSLHEGLSSHCIYDQKMSKEPLSKNEDDLLKIMTFSTALSFGLLAALLYSFKNTPEGVSFVFSAGSVLFFVLGAAAGWGMWRVVRHFIRKKKSGE